MAAGVAGPTAFALTGVEVEVAFLGAIEAEDEEAKGAIVQKLIAQSLLEWVSCVISCAVMWYREELVCFDLMFGVDVTAMLVKGLPP